MLYRYLSFLLTLPFAPFGLVYWTLYRFLDNRYTAKGHAAKQQYDALVRQGKFEPDSAQGEYVAREHRSLFDDSSRANRNASWAQNLLSAWWQLLYVKSESRTEFGLSTVRAAGNALALIVVLAVFLPRDLMHASVDLLYDGRDAAVENVETAATQTLPAWLQAKARRAIGVETEQGAEESPAQTEVTETSPSDLVVTE